MSARTAALTITRLAKAHGAYARFTTSKRRAASMSIPELVLARAYAAEVSNDKKSVDSINHALRARVRRCLL